MSIFLRGISKTLQPHCHLPSSPEPRRAQSSQSTQSEPRCQNWSSSENFARKWEGWPLGMGRYLCTFGGQDGTGDVDAQAPKLLMSSDQPALPGTPHHSPPCANGTLVHTGLIAGSARLEMVNFHGPSWCQLWFPNRPQGVAKIQEPWWVLDESWMTPGCSWNTKNWEPRTCLQHGDRSCSRSHPDIHLGSLFIAWHLPAWV